MQIRPEKQKKIRRKGRRGEEEKKGRRGRKKEEERGGAIGIAAEDFAPEWSLVTWIGQTFSQFIGQWSNTGLSFKCKIEF